MTLLRHTFLLCESKGRELLRVAHGRCIAIVEGDQPGDTRAVGMTIAFSRMRTIAHGRALIMVSRKLTTNSVSQGYTGTFVASPAIIPRRGGPCQLVIVPSFDRIAAPLRVCRGTLMGRFACGSKVLRSLFLPDFWPAGKNLEG